MSKFEKEDVFSSENSTKKLKSVPFKFSGNRENPTVCHVISGKRTPLTLNAKIVWNQNSKEKNTEVKK